jgi:hypothetical protein
MGRTVRDAKRFVADVDRTLVARQTARRGELSGVGVGEVGVAATGGPAELDDLLGAFEHLHGAPVLHTAPERRVAHALVHTTAEPRCVGARAGERIPPRGVPVNVSSRSPEAVMTPAFKNALTSRRTRLSLIRRRIRSSSGVCPISSKHAWMSASSTHS